MLYQLLYSEIICKKENFYNSTQIYNVMFLFEDFMFIFY